MLNKIIYIKVASAVVLSMLSSMVFAKNLHLQLEQSQLNFVSYKNEHIAESHSFDSFSGTLDQQGKLSIEVDLSSVNTLIPIRNERMKSMLFDVANFAKASFTASLGEEVLAMKSGTSAVKSVTGILKIKDTSQEVQFNVVISALGDNKYLATTTKPTLINATRFGLGDGISALKEIAMLKSISKTVPLSFSVVFE